MAVSLKGRSDDATLYALCATTLFQRQGWRGRVGGSDDTLHLPLVCRGPACMLGKMTSVRVMALITAAV